MICWHCRHLLLNTPAYHPEPATGADGSHILRLRCWHCGAHYEITERQLQPPTASPQHIERVRNRPR